MIKILKSNERGLAEHGWLKSFHSFSFADYYNPLSMGFRDLRVINEDWVAPGQGFGKHSHNDMEIITYVLDGELEHKDSMGSGGIIRPGEIQQMSAGTGVAHSEFNPSKTEPVHLLQIWIIPDERGVKPIYQQKTFPFADREGKLRLLASKDGREGSVVIHQSADLFSTILGPNISVSHTFAPKRNGWLQVAKGSVLLNDQTLSTGDGAAITEETTITLTCGAEKAEVLLFDLP
jgi:redox-sensitive bicupin YhaK (pirin superfamily)